MDNMVLWKQNTRSPIGNKNISFYMEYLLTKRVIRILDIKSVEKAFMFSLWCIDWVGSLYANRIFMYFCIKSSIGAQGEVS